MKNKLTILMALCAMQVVFTAEVNQKNLQKRLTQAVERRNLKEVQSLIAQGAQVKGSEALIDAIASGYVPMIKLLIKNGADVNQKFAQVGDFKDITALMYAIDIGENNISQLLIENGADLNIRGGNNKRTAFAYTVGDETRIALLTAIPMDERKMILGTKEGILAVRRKLPIKDIGKLISQDVINDLVENHMRNVEKLLSEYHKEEQLFDNTAFFNNNKNTIRAEVEQNIRRILFAPEQN